MKRILLLYATPSSGHAQASHGLKQAFESAGGYEVEEYHLLLEWPRFARFLSSSYKWLAKNVPWLWGYFHGNRSYGGLARAVVMVMFAFDLGNFRLKVRKWKPDAIICTHILPLHIIGEAKRRGRITQPLYVLPTDLWAHPFWFHPAADAFFVATDRAKQDIVGYGARPERIFVTGIPVRQEFLRLPTRAQAFAHLDLHDGIPQDDPSRKTVLVMGGSYGLLPIHDVLEAVLFDPELRRHRWLILCGSNEDAYHEAMRILEPHPDLPVHAYGFRNDMAHFMVISDLYLTKPGGLSSTESLACGLPLLLFRPLPGQERVNADWLVRNGVAREAHDLAQVINESKRLLANPAVLSGMRKRALGLARPFAGREIVALVARGPSFREKREQEAIDSEAVTR